MNKKKTKENPKETSKNNSASKKPSSGNSLWSIVIVVFLTAGVFFIGFFFLEYSDSITYVSQELIKTEISNVPKDREDDKNSKNKKSEKEEPATLPTTHLQTPSSVKAVYISSWTASTPVKKNRIVELIEETELNSIVIDIKDYSGKVAFKAPGLMVEKMGATQKRTPHIKSFINELHEKDIYVIGRIVVFQDPYLAERKNDIAVQRKDNEKIWSDKKGLHYIDPGSEFAWNYNLELAKYAYKKKGFDEINFDYIRFPSDGNISNTYYPISSSKMNKSTSTYGKPEVLEDFFTYLGEDMEEVKAKTSADLFGMTTTNIDGGMNIGQVLEKAAPHFDYIAPMVYPSHYPPGFRGWANPNNYPYEVVKYSMSTAVQRLKSASSSPSKLRPWLQDFDVGGNYGAKEVRTQIEAVYDSGLSSWMLWSPSNVYTKEALESNQ